jgi:peptide/nickel transport system ATP-binding protein
MLSNQREMSKALSPALKISGMRTEFKIGRAWYPAIRDLSLEVAPNETLAIVGESGSGKSVTALSILGLLPRAGARVAAGEIMFEGRDLTKLSEGEMSKVRGNSIAMIFQEPMTSLNPTMTVGEQIAEVVIIHQRASHAKALAQALRLLKEVNIPAAENRLHDYPHQFSGGMRQRVMIAMALACRPKVLLADEPTTALDVTIQAQVLMQLDELKKAYDMSVVFITHNLGVVAQIADRVAVMYAGEIVELATADALFAKPAHPYTAALLAAMPRADRTTGGLDSIPGSMPSLTAMPKGCAYASRCSLKRAPCEENHPELLPFGSTQHLVRCPVRREALEGRHA